MQKTRVKAFKNELRNYNYFCSRIKDLEASIGYCYDRLGGVRGIDPSKEPTHSQPNKELEYKLRADIERYEAKLARFQAKKHEIDEILERIEEPLKKAIIDVYANGNKIDNVSAKMDISPNGLAYRMNKAIENAAE